MIIANGLPKSGTHALLAFLSRMGLKRCPGVLAPNRNGLLAIKGEKTSARFDLNTLAIVPNSIFMQGHVPASMHLDDFMVVTIFRDPRNVLISYIRHRAQSWGGGKRLTGPEAISDFWGKNLVRSYEDFLGWHGRSVVVRYEDLPADQIGDGSDIYERSRPQWDRWIGNTRTGRPSDWREVWDEETEAAWQEAGGGELVARAGYGSHTWIPEAKAA